MSYVLHPHLIGLLAPATTVSSPKRGQHWTRFLSPLTERPATIATRSKAHSAQLIPTAWEATDLAFRATRYYILFLLSAESMKGIRNGACSPTQIACSYARERNTCL